jgi:hypothetical protein
MSNEKFSDLSTLSALLELHRSGTLNDADARRLVRQLKTPWGREKAKAVLSNSNDASVSYIQELAGIS